MAHISPRRQNTKSGRQHGHSFARAGRFLLLLFAAVHWFRDQRCRPPPDYQPEPNSPCRRRRGIGLQLVACCEHCNRPGSNAVVTGPLCRPQSLQRRGRAPTPRPRPPLRWLTEVVVAAPAATRASLGAAQVRNPPGARRRCRDSRSGTPARSRGARCARPGREAPSASLSRNGSWSLAPDQKQKKARTIDRRTGIFGVYFKSTQGGEEAGKYCPLVAGWRSLVKQNARVGHGRFF